MIIDHIGMIFFPNIILFRIIGRIAFPLFAWLIAHGAYHTRNIQKYMVRLGFLAIFSQLPYMVFLRLTGNTQFQLNVVFTLLAGLFAIYLIQKTKSTALKIVITCVIAVITYVAHADFGFIGVLSIVLFYTYHQDVVRIFWSQLLIFASWIILLPVFFFESNSNSLYFSRQLHYQLFIMTSIIVIAAYNHKKKSKPFSHYYYSLYPFHLIVLSIIYWLIHR